MNSRHQKIFARILLVGISSLLGLVAGEFLIRWLLPAYHPGRQVVFHVNAQGVPLGEPLTTQTVHTPKGDWTMVVRFNRHGLRDEKDLAESKAGDVFVVGDSFSFGWGLETGERYSDLLAPRIGARVFNIAIPGDLRDDARLVEYAEHRGATIGRLVLGVCMENDLKDYRAPAPVTKAKASWRDWLKLHSALYLAASHVLQARFGAGPLLEKLGVARSIEQLTGANTFSEAALASSRDEVAGIAARHPTTVLLIPSRALWHGSNTAVERQVHERFVQLLAEAGLKVVDMRPVFEASGDPLGYYFRTDPHWNPSGHAAAAEALAQSLGRER